MDIIETIEKRQSIRKFRSEDIPDGIILRILDAAGKAPSPENLQPWEFIIIKDSSVKDQIIDAIKTGFDKTLDTFIREVAAPVVEQGLGFKLPLKKIGRSGYVPLMSAPVLIVVCMNDITKIISSFSSFPRHYMDIVYKWLVQGVAAAIEHILLVAVSHGLSACWTGGAMFMEEKVKKVLEIPEHVELSAIIALGYSDHNPPKRSKKQLSEIVYINKYSNKIQLMD